MKSILGALATLLVAGLGIAAAPTQASAQAQIEAQPLGPVPGQSPAPAPSQGQAPAPTAGQIQGQVPAVPADQAQGHAPTLAPVPPAAQAQSEAPAPGEAPSPAQAPGQAAAQASTQAPGQAPGQADTVAVLQGLDKITARVSRFDAPVDQSVRFGTLVITVRACDKAPPEEPPNTVAFLQIDKVQPSDAKSAAAKQIFSGWMFASSPAVSSLEDPVYDINVLDCKTEATAAPDKTSSGK